MTKMTASDDLEARGGTYYYNTIQKVSKGGSSAHWLEIRAYNGEYPVFDFTGQPLVLFSTTEYTAIGVEKTYVKLTKLQVQNAFSCNGISGRASHFYVTGCKVLACGGSGLTASHVNFATTNDRIDDIWFNGCYVTNCVRYNSSTGNPKWPDWRIQNGYWPFALGIATATNARITYCSSWENFGEGIVMLRCAGAGLEVANNWAATNWSVNIYIDNTYGTAASYVRVAFNIADCKSGTAYADLYRGGNPAIGLEVAQEWYGSLTTGSFWIELNQNTSSNCSNGFNLGEFTTPINYIGVYGNSANTSKYSGFSANASNANISWSTNYVNGVGTTGSMPGGK
jgi:hypothetical protein